MLAPVLRNWELVAAGLLVFACSTPGAPKEQSGPSKPTVAGVATPTQQVGKSAEPGRATPGEQVDPPKPVPDAPRTPPPPNTETIERLLKSEHKGFVEPMANPEQFRVQVLLTTFTPQANGPDTIAEYRYRPDADYIYVASAIKTFGTVAALRKLQELQATGHKVDLNTPMAWCPEDRKLCFTRDKTNVEGEVITLGHELRKVHLVSNNYAFNRIYEFVGHREINEVAWELGFASVRVRHRMQDKFDERIRRTTPRIEFRPPEGEPVVIERRVSDLKLSPTEGVLVGKRHIDFDGKEQRRPKSFAKYNAASLTDLHRLTLAVHRPEYPGAPDLGLSKAHREFLTAAMAEIPAESKNPVYERPQAHFRYKLLLRGVLEVLPLERVRYAGKPGRAYGFHLDSAYIEDTQTGRAMVVTASIHANNDYLVENTERIYDRISRPFFDSLGEVLAREFLLANTPAKSQGDPGGP